MGSMAAEKRAERRTLWIVLGLNISLAAAFFATGTFGDSSALIANGLDNLSDSLVYPPLHAARGRPHRNGRLWDGCGLV